MQAKIAEAAYRSALATAKFTQMNTQAAQARAEYENVQNGLQPDGSPIPEQEPEKKKRKLATEE